MMGFPPPPLRPLGQHKFPVSPVGDYSWTWPQKLLYGLAISLLIAGLGKWLGVL
jgi:hypothetical protein